VSLVPLCVGLLGRERASTTSHVTTAVGRVWSPDRGSATTTLFNTSSTLLYPNSWIRSAPTLHHTGRSPALPNCPTRQPSLLFVEKRGMKSRSAIYFSTLKKCFVVVHVAGLGHALQYQRLSWTSHAALHASCCPSLIPYAHRLSPL
jgi:hypothetical protein